MFGNAVRHAVDLLVACICGSFWGHSGVILGAAVSSVSTLCMEPSAVYDTALAVTAGLSTYESVTF